MIVQGQRVAFAEPSSRLVVPLEHPTQRGTMLVVAFTLFGNPTTPSLASVRDTFGSARQWRLANDDLRSGGERLETWYRLGSRPDNLEIVAETCNALSVTGTALAIETAGLSPGAAVQELATLLAGRGGT